MMVRMNKMWTSSESDNGDSDGFDEDVANCNVHSAMGGEKAKEFAEKLESHISRFRNTTDAIVCGYLDFFANVTSKDSNISLEEGKSVSATKRRKSILPYDLLVRKIHPEASTEESKRSYEDHQKPVSNNNSQYSAERPSVTSRDKLAVEVRPLSKKLSPANQLVKEKVLVDNASELRAEIVNLRNTRDYLLEERQNLDSKLNDKKVFTSEEERKFIEIDEAIEAIDAAIEFKNEMMCGHGGLNKAVTKEKVPPRLVSFYEVKLILESSQGERMLLDRLMMLSEPEMRHLLYKYFKKVVDLRESGLRMEEQLVDLDREMEIKTWRIQALTNALQQMRVESEQRLVMIRKDYEEKLHWTINDFSGDTSSEIQTEDARIRPGWMGLEATPETHEAPTTSESIPQKNWKKLQASSTHTTKVTRKKNKLIIQQERSKKH